MAKKGLGDAHMIKAKPIVNTISNVNTHLTHIRASHMQSSGVFGSCHVYIKACNQRDTIMKDNLIALSEHK